MTQIKKLFIKELSPLRIERYNKRNISFVSSTKNEVTKDADPSVFHALDDQKINSIVGKLLYPYNIRKYKYKTKFTPSKNTSGEGKILEIDTTSKIEQNKNDISTEMPSIPRLPKKIINKYLQGCNTSHETKPPTQRISLMSFDDEEVKSCDPTIINSFKKQILKLKKELRDNLSILNATLRRKEELDNEVAKQKSISKKYRKIIVELQNKNKTMAKLLNIKADADALLNSSMEEEKALYQHVKKGKISSLLIKLHEGMSSGPADMVMSLLKYDVD